MASRRARSPKRWRCRRIPCHRIFRFCRAPGWCRRGGSGARSSIAPIWRAFRPSCCSCSEIVAMGGRKFARRWLKASHLVVRRSRGGRPMCERIDNVLFLCTGNTARSILAEPIVRKDGRQHFRSFSAGSQPKGRVNPLAIKVLNSRDYPTDNLRSKSWEEFAGADAPAMNFIFTVCDNAAGETCPVWPGQPMTAHWGIEDPAEVEGTDLQKEAAFIAAFRYLKNRIAAFTSLPLGSIDRLSLGTRLRDIGGIEGGASRPGKAS